MKSLSVIWIRIIDMVQFFNIFFYVDGIVSIGKKKYNHQIVTEVQKSRTVGTKRAAINETPRIARLIVWPQSFGQTRLRTGMGTATLSHGSYTWIQKSTQCPCQTLEPNGDKKIENDGQTPRRFTDAKKRSRLVIHRDKTFYTLDLNRTRICITNELFRN